MKQDDNAERAMFTTYHVLIHFADFPGISTEMIGWPKLVISVVTIVTVCTGPGKNAPEERLEEVNRAWTYCEKQSKSIELLYEGDDGESSLAKVHFNVPEAVRQNLPEPLSLDLFLVV